VVPFFLLTYTIQSLLLFRLGDTPKSFLMIYGFATIFKILSSIVFLVVCFMFIQDVASASDKIYFSLFFILSYFLFLIINTKSFFQKNDQTTQK
jgi:hypothetical protein